jgi:hypothetical protein
MPQGLLATVDDQGIVERLEQGYEALQAIGQRAQRQIETVRAQVSQQSIGGAVTQILVQQHRDPDRHAQQALGNQPWGRRGRYDAGHYAARAGGAITTATDDAAMGSNRNLQDGGVLRTPDGLEGLLALRATAGVADQHTLLDGSRQVAVIAATVPWSTGLLTTRSRCRGGGRRRGRFWCRRSRRRRFAGATEELLLA